MATAKHPFLPRLKSSTDSAKTTKLASIPERGVWQIGGKVDLNDLSNSLEIDTIDPDYIEVDSIPDMWARPILFEMAFFNKDHLLHQRFIDEWRGLLAMLALKEIRNLPLNCEEVLIPRREKREPQTEEEKKRLETAPDFIQALGDLAPLDFIVENSDWHRLYVILFDGRPIGMASPTTLVCTAVNYMTRIRDVAWFNGRLLIDPANVTGVKDGDKEKPRVSCLNDYEKKSLIEWLEYVKNHLGALATTTDDARGMQNKLIEEMDIFQEHLGKGKSVGTVKLSKTGLHLEHGIFSFLDKPVAPQQETPHTSFVKLQALGREPEPSPALLVIDRDIATQWNMADQNVIVIGATNLSSIPYSGLGTDRTRFGDKPLQGAEWVKPEMFFTQKLFYAREKDAFPGFIEEVEGMQDLNLQGEPITPILPIQPWLLKYMSLKELRGRFAFERTNDGIMARLTLSLRGPDGQGRDFAVKKEYRQADNDLQPVSQLPVIEVWPDFKATAWKAYYTYYACEKDAKTFYAAPVAPMAQFEWQKKPVDASAMVKGSNAGTVSQSYKNILLECKTPNSGDRLEQITKLDRFPEAFECFYDLPNPGSKKMDTIPAGLILLRQPEEIRQPDEWKIGIDFGTTGTNVFYSDGKLNPRALDFKDHFIKVTNSTTTERADTISYRFVAGKNAVAPFLTIYHDFDIADPAEPKLRPLLDGHIFFKNKEAIFKATDAGMHTNLKWGTGREDRKRADAFLTQLCVQCAAEAASRGAKAISWRYSFPTAFSAGETMQFENAWNNIVKKCHELTGLAATSSDVTDGSKEIGAPLAKTESVASGQFFADNPNIRTEAPFGDMGVCLDIGGGTSDISVWHANKLRWQSSIRFAGRNMLMKFFYQNPVFLKRFEREQDIASLLDLAAKSEEIRFYAELDVLLREKGDAWLEHLYTHAGEPAVIGFMQLIALSLSGLTFYVGQVLGALHNDESIAFPAKVPNIFIGGNGARMFNWLTGGVKYSVKSPISNLFKTTLIAGSGFKADNSSFQICSSPEPKSEVAYGLVSDTAKLEGTDELATMGIIAGERFVEKGKEKSWNEKLTAQRLHDGEGLARPVNLEQFRKFLEVFKNFAKSPQNKDMIKPMQDDESALNSCGQELAQRLASAKNQDTDNIHVEPLFITVLRYFLDLKIKHWTKFQQTI